MAKKRKVPSPCIDVCKFRRGGHCIGCSMTKAQKKMFKALKRPEHQHAFVDMLIHQQNDMGKYTHWAPRYARKCLKKGVHPPTGTVAKAS
ncbi:MAG: DUF1289 domain-containing protein [Pseudomonadota bacterium]